MKYILFLTDGSSRIKDDTELLGKLMGVPTEDNLVFITEEKRGIVADIYSNRLVSYSDCEIVILPSVIENVSPDTIAKKLKKIKGK